MEITTQKKLKKKFDGINTQVMAWMINKYRERIIQVDYIIENIFHKIGTVEKLKKKNVNNQHCIGTLFYKLILAFVSSDIEI